MLWDAKSHQKLGNAITFSPGDGGSYTMFLFFTDDEEGRKELAEELADRQD